MKALPSEYYGDNVRWFVADVIDSTPPYGLEGRVRVRIHGVHSPSTKDIAQADLPWAQCVIPTTEGGVSGIGGTPKLEPGALVFGFFMDGKASQVPVVLGSLPKIETPTRIQKRVEFETVVERLNPAVDFYDQEISSIGLNTDIDNLNSGNISVSVKDARIASAVRFFMSSGYTLNQSVTIASSLDIRSGMSTSGQGIGKWNETRLADLKNFSNLWNQFATQLAFVLYELNTKQAPTNIKFLRVDKLEDEGKDTCQEVFARNYYGQKNETEIEIYKQAALDLYTRLVG